MASKRIAYCVASRGNPRELVETLYATMSRCALPTTTAIVGLDEDDPTLADTQMLLDVLSTDRIVISVAPREDSIGAVYNRCASIFDADLYFNSADDGKILTQGWDALVSQAAGVFPDNIGMIGVGQLPFASVLPAVSATTRALIDKMGYFLQDYTPYWWMDTWLYEIAALIGRTHYIPMEIEFMGPLRTRGLRELAHWSTFFEEMRAHRRSIAESILASPDFLVSPERRKELFDALDHACAVFAKSQTVLRDPAYAAQVEDNVGHDAPNDERYRRIKERSIRVLQDLDNSRSRVA
jgi:hypothetical protein